MGKKYYKYIKTCKVCGRIYGIDCEEDNDICPIHNIHSQSIKRLFEGKPFPKIEEYSEDGS